MNSPLHEGFFFLLQRPLWLQFYLTELSEWFPGGNVLKTDFDLYKETLNQRYTCIYCHLPNQTHMQEQETHEVGYSRE